MSLAGDIARIRAEYPNGGPRRSLAAVERLRREMAPALMPTVVVVGTNGKTSTATYLARMLTASGKRTGLYISPHLEDWTERVRVDDDPCDPLELLESLRAVHERAESSDDELGELRFFDILTLAAEQIISRAGASVAVFEAGIGGRLDAVGALRPPLVLLTSIAVDHADVLGAEPAEILREKLLVAPAGSRVLSAPLGRELEAHAEDLAAEAGIRLAWMDSEEVDRLDLNPELPGYLRSAFALAVQGLGQLGATLGPLNGTGRSGTAAVAIDERIPGRLERGERDGVPYVLDAGHNEAAWSNLVSELERRPIGGADGSPVTAVISVSRGKERQGLPAALQALRGLDAVIVTRHTPLPAADPELVAAELRQAGGVEVRAVEDVGSACRLAFERARQLNGGVLVFGSTHLVGDVRGLLQE